MLQHIIFPCDIPYTPIDSRRTTIGLAFISLFRKFIHDLFCLFTATFKLSHDKRNTQNSVNFYSIDQDFPRIFVFQNFLIAFPTLKRPSVKQVYQWLMIKLGALKQQKMDFILIAVKMIWLP